MVLNPRAFHSLRRRIFRMINGSNHFDQIIFPSRARHRVDLSTKRLIISYRMRLRPIIRNVSANIRQITLRYFVAMFLLYAASRYRSCGHRGHSLGFFRLLGLVWLVVGGCSFFVMWGHVDLGGTLQRAKRGTNTLFAFVQRSSANQ